MHKRAQDTMKQFQEKESQLQIEQVNNQQLHNQISELRQRLE